MCLWSFSHKYYTVIVTQLQHSYVICLYRKEVESIIYSNVSLA